MKVKELINELEKYDGDLEVMTKERYSEGVRKVSEVSEKYETLDKSYVYIS